MKLGVTTIRLKNSASQFFATNSPSSHSNSMNIIDVFLLRPRQTLQFSLKETRSFCLLAIQLSFFNVIQR